MMNGAPAHRIYAMLLLTLGLLGGKSAPAAEGPTRIELDRFQPTDVTVEGKKVPCGTVRAEDGPAGKAFSFHFIEGASGGFMAARVRPTEEWDRAEGFSFWVKGDGSSRWGGIELIDLDDFRLRYGYCFPIDSTDWKKIVVPWGDVIPEVDGALIDARNGGYAPSHLGNFWFGKWFYWRDYPAETFSVERVALERRIELPRVPKREANLGRVRAKLRSHQPITVVTMGDSLTDVRHWSNRQTRWPQYLAESIKAAYGSEAKIVDPAIGGTTLSQNLVLMPRWSSEAPSPDLVTVWFGGNDWDSGVRAQRFAQYLRLAVERIRRQTGGSADILLMTPCPSFERWETYKELEQATRDVAKETGVTLVDEAAAFRDAGTPAEAMKREYWAWDKTHLGIGGQKLAAEQVMAVLKEAGKDR
jgi:lysophospholipase L1-like esterase